MRAWNIALPPAFNDKPADIHEAERQLELLIDTPVGVEEKRDIETAPPAAPPSVAKPVADPNGKGTKIEVDGLARYSDPLTALGKRILKSRWTRQFAVQFASLRAEAWEGSEVSDAAIERRLQDIEKRWMTSGLDDIDLEISPATTSVKLVKPLAKTGDKKGDN